MHVNNLKNYVTPALQLDHVTIVLQDKQGMIIYFEVWNHFWSQCGPNRDTIQHQMAVILVKKLKTDFVILRNRTFVDKNKNMTESCVAVGNMQCCKETKHKSKDYDFGVYPAFTE
ncbi:MAG: hypothetical protein EZS28_003714 [Streblomastix strix]|uniref:Uncharacterized protein n=1 Tax=Streblomastix strix TaxID=222440 RepID=A0A5J4X0K2_9EUKA|nr:MAG: hypothetical protein EZS28_003714 [Streblomastix strix]